MEFAKESWELADAYVLMKTRESLVSVLVEWRRYVEKKRLRHLLERRRITQVAHLRQSSKS